MPALRLATWNINSIRSRLDSLDRFVAAEQPDVICLQETRAQDSDFPLSHITDGLGYPHVALKGQKMHSGVAILSRLPLTRIDTRLWCDQDDCRHLSAVVAGHIEVHNFYVPAGGDVPDPATNPKFAHKLAFLDEMTLWGKDLPGGGARSKRKRVLVGDLNVAPLPSDVWSHKQLLNIVSHTPPETTRLDAARDAHGWVDALRHSHGPDTPLFTWWSYRAKDWRASNRGRRLDHVWLTPALAGVLEDARIIDATRDWPKASDHVPVVVRLKV